MAWHSNFTQFLASTKDHTKASFLNTVFQQVLDNDNYLKENKLDVDKVVNTTTETIAGKALDATQANPSITGSLAQQIWIFKSADVLFNGTVSTGDIVLSYPVTNYNELVIGTGSSTTLLTIRVTHLAFPANFTVGTNFTVPTSNGVASLTVKDANTITINSTQLAIRRILGKKV